MRKRASSQIKGTPRHSATVEDLVDAICTARGIIVILGAGISVAANLPDFRSKAGIFAQMREQYRHQGIKRGEDMFRRSAYESTRPLFLKMIAELVKLKRQAKPTRAHELLKKLDDMGKLVRVYTQNFDALEAKAGLSYGIPEGTRGDAPRVVPLHGALDTMTCLSCQQQASIYSNHVRQNLEDGVDTPCENCFSRNSASLKPRVTKGRQVLRPDLVLYDEPHPKAQAIGTLCERDIRDARVDLLLVIGTTLKVYGVQKLVKAIAGRLHASRRRGSSIKTALISLSLPDVSMRPSFDCVLSVSADEVARQTFAHLANDAQMQETAPARAPRHQNQNASATVLQGMQPPEWTAVVKTPRYYNDLVSDLRQYAAETAIALPDHQQYDYVLNLAADDIGELLYGYMSSDVLAHCIEA